VLKDGLTLTDAVPYNQIGATTPLGLGRINVISYFGGGSIIHARLAAIILLFSMMIGVSSAATSTSQDMPFTKVKVSPLPSQTKEIRLLQSFPTDKDEANGIFLAQAQYFSVDSNGRIYVSDVKANEVLIFERDGRFVRKIGRTGQGPGEFNLVGRALMTSRGLAVLDRSNARIQYFDDRGRFVDSIKLTKSYGDMAIGTDGTMFLISMPYATDEIISAIDSDGRIKATFGQPPQALLKKPSLRVCWPRVGPKGEIFIAFWFFPFIQVYSSTGELRYLFELRYSPIQERLANNEARTKTVQGGARSIGEGIIEAIDADEDGFYILYRGKRIEILEFKSDGTFVKTYWTAQAPDYYPRGLLVLRDGGQKTFYLLQAMPENRIDVFVEK
jgi:hypothetical protein